MGRLSISSIALHYSNVKYKDWILNLPKTSINLSPPTEKAISGKKMVSPNDAVLEASLNNRFIINVSNMA